MSAPAPARAGTRRRRLDGRVGGMVMLLVFLVLTFLPLGEQLRLLVFDGYQTVWPRERKTAPAVVVAIDETSLAAHGQWPWPRSLLAELVQKIAAAQPAGIALDLILPEPDRYSPVEYARSVGLPEPLTRALSLLPDNDRRLADAVRAHRVVVGVTGLDYGDPRFPNPPQVAPLRSEPGLEAGLRSYSGVLKNRPVIDRAAAGRGLVNSASGDRIVRRIPFVAKVKGVITPTLALELWRVASGSPLLSLTSGDGGLLQLSFADREIPLQSDGSFWLYASRASDAHFVSASEVLSGRVDPERLRSHLVLIGVTGLALVDRRVTPLREEVPGVELHAQVIEQIFDNSYLVRSSTAPWLERLLLVAGCALLILWVPRLRSREAVAVAVLLLAFEALIGAVAFRASGLLLDIATPMLATLTTFIVMLAATLEQAEQQRRSLRDAATRVAGELAAARRIQSGLLAEPAIQFRNERAFDIDAYLEPAQTVGGDFFECVKLDQRRLLFAVGDVSGKGMAAALFMALTKAILKATALRADGDVSGIVGRAASEIALENPEIDVRHPVRRHPRPGHRHGRILQRGSRTAVRRRGGACAGAFPDRRGSAAVRGRRLCVRNALPRPRAWGMDLRAERRRDRSDECAGRAVRCGAGRGGAGAGARRLARARRAGADARPRCRLRRRRAGGGRSDAAGAALGRADQRHPRRGRGGRPSGR